MTIQQFSPKSIFLADDDADDRMLFEDALREICKQSKLTIATDGRQLMQILYAIVSPTPDVIFLDLNMPGKNGFECLDEIKKNPNLKDIPVIVFSTTIQPEAVDKVYEQGANYFICKPGTFQLLKSAIKYVMQINWSEGITQPPKEKFILKP